MNAQKYQATAGERISEKTRKSNCLNTKAPLDMRQHFMPRILDTSQAISDNIVEYRDEAMEESDRWEKGTRRNKR